MNVGFKTGKSVSFVRNFAIDFINAIFFGHYNSINNIVCNRTIFSPYYLGYLFGHNFPFDVGFKWKANER